MFIFIILGVANIAAFLRKANVISQEKSYFLTLDQASTEMYHLYTGESCVEYVKTILIMRLLLLLVGLLKLVKVISLSKQSVKWNSSTQSSDISFLIILFTRMNANHFGFD